MISTFVNDDYKDILFINFIEEISEKDIVAIDNKFDELITKGTPFVIINLSNVKTIKGSPIGDLIEWRSKISHSFQGDIVLANPNEIISNTLTEWEVDKIFPIFDSTTDAINYLFWEYKGLTENILFSIPSNLIFVPPIRTFVRNAVSGKNYSDREAFQIEMIVDELCNNAIEHGSKDTLNIVEISISLGRDKIEINVANGIDYISSNSNQVTENMMKWMEKPNTSIDEPRGRGLALVKMLVNDFDIDSSEDGTCVHVTKYRED